MMSSNYYALPSSENQLIELPAEEANGKGFYGYTLPPKDKKTKVKYNLYDLIQEANSQPQVQEIPSKPPVEEPNPKTGKEEVQDVPRTLKTKL